MDECVRGGGWGPADCALATVSELGYAALASPQRVADQLSVRTGSHQDSHSALPCKASSLDGLFQSEDFLSS